MKKLLISLIFLALAGAGVYGYYKYGKPEDKATVNEVPLSQGNVVQQVISQGTLEAMRTVQVGSQVSGIVQDLPVDYNSIVKKGQVIARLDPTLLQVQVDIQNANIQRQQSDIANQEVQLENDKKNLERTQALGTKGLVNVQQVEQAQLQVKTREAQINSARKSLVQTEAALGQAKLNVEYCTIKAPVDGVIVDRKVDTGQAVQASMTTPQFFTIATDLTTLKLSAGVDEADIGYIRRGMRVTFTVESYGQQQFQGFVDAVRLNASTNNNVVTYPVWITVSNPDLRLRPSMTASIRIVVDSAENVLKVPNTALRFRPSNDIYTWLGMPAPAPGQGRGRGANAVTDAAGRPGGQGADSGAPNALAGSPTAAGAGRGQNAQANPSGGNQNRRPRDQSAQGAPGGSGVGQNAQGAGGGRGQSGEGAGRGSFSGGGRNSNMTPEERARLREQFAASGGQPGGAGGGRQGGGQGFGRGNTNLTPEQIAQMQERFGRGGRGGGQGNRTGGQTGFGGGGRGGRAAANEAVGDVTPMTERNADKIDELFAPVVKPTSRGQVWLYNAQAADPKDRLKQINVTLGLSDGTFSEIVQGEGLAAGVKVVTNVVPPPSAVKAMAPGNNLFNQQPNRGFGGPGGFGGGPGGGGGGAPRGGGGGGGGGRGGGN